MDSVRNKYQVPAEDFKAIFESTQGLYLILHPDLTIVAVSDAYLEATMTRRNEIIGRGLFEVFPDNPDDKAATGELNLRASLALVLQNRKSHTMAFQKYDIRRPGGTFEARYWSPINKPVLNKAGEVIYIIHRVEDVTEYVNMQQKEVERMQLTEDLKKRLQEIEVEVIKRAQEIQVYNQKLETEMHQRMKVEEALEKNVRLLEEANKELDSFSYSVSHDLRSPLRIINGFANLLEEDKNNVLSDESADILEKIGQNIKRMNHLIDDLLEFARLGKKQLSTSLIDMDALVKNILENQRSMHNPKAEVKTGTLKPVKCDGALMEHVWENLVSNAFKYSQKKEKPVVEIGCHEKDGHVIYYVKDNGVGFSMEYADQLFGVFQRLHKSSDFEGTGVGLAIARRIIQKHEGKIWADAAVDKGSTFYFSLPAA